MNEFPKIKFAKIKRFDEEDSPLQGYFVSNVEAERASVREWAKSLSNYLNQVVDDNVSNGESKADLLLGLVLLNRELLRFAGGEK